jgi:predicted kinase
MTSKFAHDRQGSDGSEVGSVRDMTRPLVSVLVGLQASGKTTFSRTVLDPAATRVSKDDFPNARHRQTRQLRLIDAALTAGQDVVVDNTNPSAAEWAPLVEAAQRHGARVVAYWFPPDVEGSYQRNAARTGRAHVPDVGFYATLDRLTRPSVANGFDAVFAVRFDGAGGFDVRPEED